GAVGGAQTYESRCLADRPVRTFPRLPRCRMIDLFKSSRRERLRALPFPGEWERIVERNVSAYAHLSAEDRRELLGHAQVLLAEKHWEGCAGLELTDEIRVTIAAQASILLLHRDTDYYPRLTSILVYPSAYVVPGERPVGGG